MTKRWRGSTRSWSERRPARRRAEPRLARHGDPGLEQIVDYISEHDFDAAMRLRQSVARCAERLPAHPFMYRRGRSPGTREAVITPNYILVYRVTAEAVEIINVLHTRQQYP